MSDEVFSNINPTDDELRQFAYDPRYKYVDQDWDICAVRYEQRGLYLEFALDGTCPQQDLFLNMLYVLVGSLVFDSISSKMTYDAQTRNVTYLPPDKTPNQPLPKTVQERVLTIVRELRDIKDPAIQTLSRDIKERIVEAKADFNYNFWFGCGWAQRKERRGPHNQAL